MCCVGGGRRGVRGGLRLYVGVLVCVFGRVCAVCGGAVVAGGGMNLRVGPGLVCSAAVVLSCNPS